MCSIVLYHTANIYMEGKSWHVSDPGSVSYVFNLFNESLPFFRNPGFFIISGFFTLLILKKYGALGFLKSRLSRVIVPLIFTGLTLNSAQSYFKYSYIGEHDCSFIWYLKNQLLTTWIDGSWASHLWFLINLVYYYLFAALFFSFKDRMMFKKNRVPETVRSILIKKNLYLLILPFATLPFYVIRNLFPVLTGTHFFNVLIYIPFFFFGFWLFNDERLQKEFCTIYNWTIPVLMLALFVFYNTSSDNVMLEKILRVYVRYLASWIMVHYCFSLFYHFFDFKSDLIKFLSEASYTIYLFHNIIVITMGYYLIQFDVPAMLKFLIILLVTSIITISIHVKIINKYKLARFAFNGK